MGSVGFGLIDLLFFFKVSCRYTGRLAGGMSIYGSFFPKPTNISNISKNLFQSGAAIPDQVIRV